MQDKFSLLQEALNFIKNIAGLDLTLIEKVDLRNRLDYYINFHEFLEGGADIESALSFLNNNYNFGVYCYQDLENYINNKSKLLRALGYDYYAFNFKKTQEEQFKL